jgi:hypothetical protein
MNEPLINATIRIGPRQCGQTSGSAAKTFLRKRAQVPRHAFAQACRPSVRGRAPIDYMKAGAK